MKTESAIDLDNKHVRSYANQATLVRKMEEAGVDQTRHLVVRTPSGRWTAVLLGLQQRFVGTGWPMVG